MPIGTTLVASGSPSTIHISERFKTVREVTKGSQKLHKNDIICSLKISLD